MLLINADGSALQFNNPKVQASIAANTYVVSGPSQPKREQGEACLLLGETSKQWNHEAKQLAPEPRRCSPHLLSQFA